MKLTSKQMLPEQLRVLSHEACFNTTGADPVNLVATVESILKHTGDSDETKLLVRQRVTTLLMAHKPRAIITRAEQDAPKRLRADAEVARTRMREQGTKYRTFLGTMRTVFAEDGFLGLYRGLGTHYIRQIPNSCLMIGTYEGVVFLLDSWDLVKRT
ncbi:unnamed protein product [Schistocephalus solidus]|uniref:Mitochondrial carrier n=1 Tax=Schistocephalus solidus TaxID=70667 RepID=A0A183TRM6_SCHSO|nr:unnamed protein product [Schistocephalus solidus]